jgi:MarR family transcriptional regulator, temperature-dependent positive regulator of motility
MTLEQKLHRAQQRLGDAYDLEPDLTSRQYVVLSCLTERDGISQTKIVEETCIDRSTTASMIAQLVRRGLVSRQRSRVDARAYVVSVTAAGRAAVKAAKPKIAKADRKALAALNQDQRIALMAALDTIAG